MTQKKKLLVVSGAGASLDFGMPSVNKIHEDFLGWASMHYPLARHPKRSLYSELYRKACLYMKKHVPPPLQTMPTFEDILYLVYALASTWPAGAYTSGFGSVVQRRKLPDVLQYRAVKSVDENVLSTFAAQLVDTLLNDIRTRCIKEEASNKLFIDFQGFFDALQSQFEVSVATTNYDNLAVRALPAHETGFDLQGDGSFSPRRIFKRPTWECILHLHGSVHFAMHPGMHGLHTVYWQKKLSAGINQTAFGRNGQYTKEGIVFPTSTIIAGYGKTGQIQLQPFRTMYSELDRLVAEADAVLFLGYGFGDAHVNNAFAGFHDHRGRSVVVVDYATDTVSRLGSGLPESSRAIEEAAQIFSIDARSMKWAGDPEITTGTALRNSREFERSAGRNGKLSIWYSGMHAACTNPDRILGELI
ncbi:Uncharacterised protein [Burkholderia pseudomallei]|nr:Uncharacterised protein [Burkholderia pseudomallei]